LIKNVRPVAVRGTVLLATAISPAQAHCLGKIPVSGCAGCGRLLEADSREKPWLFARRSDLLLGSRSSVVAGSRLTLVLLGRTWQEAFGSMLRCRGGEDDAQIPLVEYESIARYDFRLGLVC